MNRSMEQLRDDYIRDLEALDEKIISHRVKLNNMLSERPKKLEEIRRCRQVLIVLENERDEMNLSIREMTQYLEE